MNFFFAKAFGVIDQEPGKGSEGIERSLQIMTNNRKELILSCIERLKLGILVIYFFIYLLQFIVGTLFYLVQIKNEGYDHQTKSQQTNQ